MIEDAKMAIIMDGNIDWNLYKRSFSCGAGQHEPSAFAPTQPAIVLSILIDEKSTLGIHRCFHKFITRDELKGFLGL